MKKRNKKNKQKKELLKTIFTFIFLAIIISMALFKYCIDTGLIY